MVVGDAYVLIGFLTQVLTQLFSFQSHRLLSSHASAEVRGENTPERKVASTRDQTHNHQVMSPTCSPPGRGLLFQGWSNHNMQQGSGQSRITIRPCFVQSDLDLHRLQKQVNSGFSNEKAKKHITFRFIIRKCFNSSPHNPDL